MHFNNKMYGGYELYHPNGFLMCRCDAKRYNWYVSRNLANEIGDKKAQLTFTPKGVGHSDDKNPYFLEDRINNCVVCGTSECLTKHHVVPYQFRKHMPKEYIDHKWFDVLSLCEECHHKYEKEANIYKKELETEYYPRETDKKTNIVDICKFVNTLILHHEKIPTHRKNALVEQINQYYDKNYSLEEILVMKHENSESSKLERIVGKHIVENYLKKHSITSFIVMWREHFLKTMNPQHLNKSWIDHHQTQF